MAVGMRVPLPPPPRDAGEAPSAPGPLQPGDILEGRYQVEEPLDAGGVGVVYRALHLRLGRAVAVKVLQRETEADPSYRPRFEREARALATLSHPHIVAIQDYGVAKGQPFLVLELLEGETLRARIDRGALPVEQAILIAQQILHGLSHAHGRGLVHRDLKPGNVFLQRLPTQPAFVKLLDFGFVKLTDPSAGRAGDTAKLTRAGTTFGTPAYMSPEHALGGDVDERSDLYAVGVLLYEMINGKKPFDGTIEEIFRQLAGDHPAPALARDRPDLAPSQALREAVARALSKHPKDRFQSAAEMLEALDKAPERAGVGAGGQGRTPSLRPALAAVGEGVRGAAQRVGQGASALGARAERWGRASGETAGRWLVATAERLTRAVKAAQERAQKRLLRGASPAQAEPSGEETLQDGEDTVIDHAPYRGDDAAQSPKAGD